MRILSYKEQIECAAAGVGMQVEDDTVEHVAIENPFERQVSVLAEFPSPNESFSVLERTSRWRCK
jgi:hypothetical protein